MAAPILAVMAPTAMGKSALALRLAAEFPVDIISVDAAMVYRQLDIGTAKPSSAQRAAHRHWLIDVCDPSEAYSVGRFYQDVTVAIEQVQAQGRIALLIGGTMMYFRALQQGLAPLPPADRKVRILLQQQLQEQGCAALHRQLQQVDPDAAARMAPSDPQRIMRALEVWQLTGQSITSLQQHSRSPWPHIAFYRWLPSDRVVLRQRIAQRFTEMLRCGFLDEVRALYQRGDLCLQLPAIRSVGYRQAWQHLQGDLDELTWHERALTATNQLAKRQCTWLKSWDEATWLRGSTTEVYQQLATHCQKVNTLGGGLVAPDTPRER